MGQKRIIVCWWMMYDSNIGESTDVESEMACVVFEMITYIRTRYCEDQHFDT